MILSKPVETVSRVAPVAVLYRLYASTRESSVRTRRLVISNGILTGGKEDEGGSSVDNTGSVRQDGGRSTVPDGLVDTPEFAGGSSRRARAVQLRVSMDLLKLRNRVLT